MTGAVKLYPSWKEAHRRLLEDGATYGSIITHQQLAELFGLRQPVTAEEQKRFQMSFTANMVSLRDHLLVHNQMALRTVYGKSCYEVVLPENQTDFAVKEGMGSIRKAMKTMALTLSHTPTHLLTSEQQRRNADALAKTAMLAGMVSSAKRALTSPPKRA